MMQRPAVELTEQILHSILHALLCSSNLGNRYEGGTGALRHPLSLENAVVECESDHNLHRLCVYSPYVIHHIHRTDLSYSRWVHEWNSSDMIPRQHLNGSVQQTNARRNSKNRLENKFCFCFFNRAHFDSFIIIFTWDEFCRQVVQYSRYWFPFWVMPGRFKSRTILILWVANGKVGNINRCENRG